MTDVRRHVDWIVVIDVAWGIRLQFDSDSEKTPSKINQGLGGRHHGFHWADAGPGWFDGDVTARGDRTIGGRGLEHL